MESVRALRIILAPSVLIGALLLGKWLNGSLKCGLAYWGDSLPVLAAAVAASVIPLGFILGGITRILLEWLADPERRPTWAQGPKVPHVVRSVLTRSARLLSPCFAENGQVGFLGRHDLLVGPDVVAQIQHVLGQQASNDGHEALYAAQTFAYSRHPEWIPERVAAYLDRLWDASIAYAGSMVALFVALVLSPCLVGVDRWLALWVILVLGAGWLFANRCRAARAEIGRLVTFHALLR